MTGKGTYDAFGNVLSSTYKRCQICKGVRIAVHARVWLATIVGVPGRSAPRACPGRRCTPTRTCTASTVRTNRCALPPSFPRRRKDAWRVARELPSSGAGALHHVRQDRRGHKPVRARPVQPAKPTPWSVQRALLSPPGQSRVTLSPRQEHFKSSLSDTAGGKRARNPPKHGARRPRCRGSWCR